MEATETATTPSSAETTTPAVPATLLSDATVVVTPPTTEAAATPSETAEAKPEVKAEGAPEKYEFKAPEGNPYDTNILSAFEAAAKDANLSQDAAQKLLDSMSPKIAERQAEQVLAINKEWLDSSKSDKEFGGDALDANLGVAKKALDQFGTPELSKFLATTGLGNNPEIIRFCYRAGKAISQDTFVTGAAAVTNTGPTSMYPNSNMK